MTPFVDIHTHVNFRSNNTIALLSVRAGVDNSVPHHPFSVGIHPWDAGLVNEDPELLLQSFLPLHPAAIGEIGLDSLHSTSTIDQQSSLFRKQLYFAHSNNLPVIIHSVRTLQQILRIMDDFPSVKAVFHSFIGNRIQAQQIIDRGHFISAGLTSLASHKTLDALSYIPANRLFLETDDNLSPIQTVYNIAAEKLALKPVSLIYQIYLNYSQLFNSHGNS